MTTCTADECGRDAVARGLCDAHRARQRLGIPMDAPVRRQITKAEKERLRPQVLQMRRDGASYPEIAAATGMNRETVRKMCAAAGLSLPTTEIPHGRPSAWVHHHCTCDICLIAKREYKRAEYEARLERADVTAEHGTTRAYGQGCRCDDCASATRERSAQRQPRTVPGAMRHGHMWTAEDAEIALDSSLTIEQRAARLGRTHAAIDDWLAAYQRRKKPARRERGGGDLGVVDGVNGEG